jgi:hypothetical protein
MSSSSEEPIAQVTASKTTWRNVLAIALVCALIGALGIGVWQMRPKKPPIGRPIGGVAHVQAYAIPALPAGEGFTIWRDGRQVYALPNKVALGFQRIELSSADVDIIGNHEADLVLYGWTGGAHCCFTQFVIDGHTGRLLGQLELGNGDALPFLPGSKAGLAKAAVVNYDDVTAYKFGSFADSPMARVVLAWDGKKFGLDLKRMKAAQPESPPAYFIDEADLADALPLFVLNYGESEDDPVASGDTGVNGGVRGDRAKTYQAWMAGEEARMKATTLNPADDSSFGPMAAFLNERIYKGQGVAGVASVTAAYEQMPEARAAALAHYFSVLKTSRWFDDLNRLNDGQLMGLWKTATTAQAAPASVPATPK